MESERESESERGRREEKKRKMRDVRERKRAITMMIASNRNLLSSNINIFIEFVLTKKKGKKRREKSGISHSTYVYIAEIIKLKIHLSLGDSFAFYEKFEERKKSRHSASKRYYSKEIIFPQKENILLMMKRLSRKKICLPFFSIL